MSEYNILLKPTRLSEQWFEVPRISCCDKHGEVVKTWEQVIESAEDFGYKTSPLKTYIHKVINIETTLVIRKNGEISILKPNDEVLICRTTFNNALLFILFMEGRL